MFYCLEKNFNQIDVTFIRYRETSIKCATRKKRSRGHGPIRRVTKDGTVPLPKHWSNFLALHENKAYLVRVLLEKLLVGAPVDKERKKMQDARKKMQPAPLKVYMKGPTLK